MKQLFAYNLLFLNVFIKKRHKFTCFFISFFLKYNIIVNDNIIYSRYWGRGGTLLLLLVGGIHVDRRSIIVSLYFLDWLFSWLLRLIKLKADLYTFIISTFLLYILIHLTLKVCNKFTACRKFEISFPFFSKEHLPSSVATYKPFAASLTEYNIALGPIIIKLALFGCMILLSFYIPVICKHRTTASSLLMPSNTNRSITHLFSIKSLVRSEVILPIDVSALAISTFAVSTSFRFFLALNRPYTALTSTLNPLDFETPDESPTLSPLYCTVYFNNNKTNKKCFTFIRMSLPFEPDFFLISHRTFEYGPPHLHSEITFGDI